jgi:hypothetical protein
MMVTPEQLSVTVGAVQEATAVQEPPAERLMFAGQPEITGALTSITVTVKVHCAELPMASIAV